MKIKKWNGSAWVQDYPEVDISSIVATGTPSGTTFLRGDGQWAVPAGVDNFLNTTGDTSTGMQSFYTALTNNYDYQNSPISIRERGGVGSGTGADNQSPNLNFHWSGRVTNSLWMGADARLNWGGYSAAGIPAAAGIFRTGILQSTVATGTAPLAITSTTAVTNLNADLLDGSHASAFVLKSGDTMTGALTVNAAINGSRYYQNANGSPTSNLGTPTVTEMALFDEQFDNKTAFANISRISAQTSTDNITWTEFSLTDAQKRGLVGGDNGTTINIPYNTTYFRFKFLPGSYVFANALYVYWASQGHSTAVQIYKKHDSGTYTQHTSSTAQVGAWPGHLYLPFTTIPWMDGGTLGTHFDDIYIVFIPTWNATYSANSIQINKLQIWGGYPAGKRNVFSTDENANVAFSGTIQGTRLISTIATGTSPLAVTSTTAVTNLNADLLDGNHSTAFAAAVHTHDVLSERSTITYGLSGLQWNDTSGVGGTGLNGAAPNNPTNEWWHHLIMNHGNATGYYVDIAAAFHTDDLYLRRNVGGTLSTWRKIWNEGNDGAASGLDADLLDGNHASAFLLTTARNAANGVAPLDATSKVPVANLPDFITGAGRGFYLVGTISGAVSLSAASTGLVAQLVALSGGDYENMYGYMWTAADTVTLTWTDQTTLGPVYQYHVLTPGDEGDSTSPVTLEAGDMIVFTKYSDTAGDSNDQQFTFSVINSSDPRFANYVPLTGGNITGTLNVSNTIGVGTTSPLLNSAGKFIHIHSADTNASAIHFTNNTTGSGAAAGLIIGRWNDATSKNLIYTYNNEPITFGTNNLERMHIIGNGNVGIGTASPSNVLQVKKDQTSDTSVVISNAGTSGATTTMSFVLQESDTPQGWFRRYRDGTAKTEIGFSDLLTFSGAVTGTKVERMRIASDGNVGIGTSNPSYSLHIAKASGDTYTAISSAGGATLLGTVASGNTVLLNDTNDKPITIWTTTGGSFTEKMRITAAGNVGVGTTAPAVKLHVVGGTRITGQLNVMGDAETKRLWVDYEDGNDMGTIQVVQDGVAYKNLALQPDGNNVGIGTRTPAERLDVLGVLRSSNANNDRLVFQQADRTSAPSLSFAGMGNGSAVIYSVGQGVAVPLAIGTYADTPFILATQNAERIRITGTGNVGIGTASPIEKLHIDINSATKNYALIGNQNGGVGIGVQSTGIPTIFNYAAKGIVFAGNYNTTLTEQMRIDSAGNVGIGTSSPISKLEVLSTTSEGPSNNGILRFSTNTGADDRGNKIGSVAGAGTLGYSYWQAVRPGVANDGNISFNPLGGNVGIGTTTPGEKLEVVGNAKATTFISTQATGTAPLTVASTTAVTNLNADLLDGNHAAAFLLTSAVKEQLKFLYVYGKAQSAITKGQAVQFAGVQGDHILMKPAVPSEINTNPDYFIGLAEATLATNDFGYILTQGELINVNTSTYTAGNILWFASAGSTAGALTATEPTGTNAKIQVGAVTKVNATEGIILTRMHIFGVEIADIAASGTPSNSTFLRGDGAWSSVTASNVGLGNVTNESKATMFSSPTFTGTVSGITAAMVGAAATSHTHGNIQSGGTMTGSTISPGSGVNILVSGSDNVIGKATIAFGTGTTTFLRNDGQWGSLSATVALATASVIGGIEIGFTSTETNRAITLSGNKGLVALPRQIPAVTLNGSSSTSPTFFASTTGGTANQFLRSNGASAPTFQDTTADMGTSSAINSSSDYTISVTGFRLAIVALYRDTTTKVAEYIVNLNNTDEFSTTTRNFRYVWNDGTSTFGNLLQVQNSSGLRLRHGSGGTMIFRVTGVR